MTEQNHFFNETTYPAARLKEFNPTKILRSEEIARTMFPVGKFKSMLIERDKRIEELELSLKIDTKIALELTQQNSKLEDAIKLLKAEIGKLTSELHKKSDRMNILRWVKFSEKKPPINTNVLLIDRIQNRETKVLSELRLNLAVLKKEEGEKEEWLFQQFSVEGLNFSFVMGDKFLSERMVHYPLYWILAPTKEEMDLEFIGNEKDTKYFALKNRYTV